MNSTNDAQRIFRNGLEAVSPTRLIMNSVKVEDDELLIESHAFELKKFKRIHIISLGKAAAAMAQAVEDILVANAVQYRGIVVVKKGCALPLQDLEMIEAGHPLPDGRSVYAAQRLEEYVHTIQKEDLTLCLVSGGSSSLILDKPEGSSLEEMQRLFDDLIKKAIPIEHINTVRKRLSNLKGGGLLSKIRSDTVVNLFLSDVPGDDLSVIGSGPTVYDESGTTEEAIEILSNNKLWQGLPDTLKIFLQEKQPHTYLKDQQVMNVLLGNNQTALIACADKAKELGYDTIIVQRQLTGEISHTCDAIVQEYKKMDQKQPYCLIWGGEPIVTVSGDGKGGRCQHMALLMLSKMWKGELPEDVTFMAAGTDGGDGSTDMAGAWINGMSLQSLTLDPIRLDESIANFDSYNFFRDIGGQIYTGETYTNVMDIMILLKNRP